MPRPLNADRLVRLPLAAGVAALAAACAARGAAKSQDAVQVEQSTRVVTPGVSTSSIVQTRTVTEDVVRASTLAVAPERVWEALPAVYADLKLPVTLQSQGDRQLGSQGRRVRGSLGGTRMSLMFSCGPAAGGGEAADSYELTVDLVSQVATGPTTGEAVLRTFATAVAKPMMTSGEPVRCVSTGRLEEKVTEAVRKRAAG